MVTRKKYLAAIALLLPAVLLYSVFVMNPTIQTGYLSLFQWNGIPSVPLKFVGLKNFTDMFSGIEFWKSLKNSGWFMLIAILVELPLAFILANIITSKIKFVRFFKVSFFIPVVLPTTAVGIIWTYILYPNGGVVNTILEAVGLGNWALDWLTNSNTAIITTALVYGWISAGFTMLIIAAGIVAIPEEIYECANLDGAAGLKKFYYITLPMLVETLKICAILMITDALKVFDIIFVMTKGGPNRLTETPVVLLYNEAFLYNNFGYGSSVGTFILVAGITISVLLNKALNRKDY